jgi:Protein of unknown function (DUF3309).
MSTLAALILAALCLLLIAVSPFWKWSKGWHWGPAFIVGIFIAGLLTHIYYGRI